jgi:hypothetical protein
MPWGLPALPNGLYHLRCCEACLDEWTALCYTNSMSAGAAVRRKMVSAREKRSRDIGIRPALRRMR